jgi:hypothetical protein
MIQGKNLKTLYLASRTAADITPLGATATLAHRWRPGKPGRFRGALAIITAQAIFGTGTNLVETLQFFKNGVAAGGPLVAISALVTVLNQNAGFNPNVGQVIRIGPISGMPIVLAGEQIQLNLVESGTPGTRTAANVIIAEIEFDADSNWGSQLP